MKETEITVEVLEDIESVKNKLINKGFRVVEKVEMIDYYFSKYSHKELENFDYADLIKNSFLIRNVVSDNYSSIRLVYKDKIVDKNNNVIAEQKIKCDINDTMKAVAIFKASGINCWCELKQNMLVFDNGEMDIVLQEVEGVGTFIEYEENETMLGLSEYEKIELMISKLKSLDINIGDDYSCKKVLIKLKRRI